MQVTFKNTGMLKAADIRLKGLTVLAGENDTGKSTVGKLLYAVIKTFNRYERDAKAFRVKKLDNLIEQFYFDYRKEYSDPATWDVLKDFFDQLKNDTLTLLEPTTPSTKESIETKVSQTLDNLTRILQPVSGVVFNFPEIPARIATLIDELPDENQIFKNTFFKYCHSLLNGEIANKFTAGEEYSITAREGNTTIFHLHGEKNKLTIQLDDLLYYGDATFIESPVLLNLSDTIRFAGTVFDMNGDSRKQTELLEKGYVPEYMKDLILKLTRPVTINEDDIVTRIKTIIGGDFYYSHDDNQFIFEKGNRSFKGVAIAQGIKYLGIIGILIQTGFLNKKNLLVLDEPENHLHPKWQIELADMLVQLVNAGSNILLTTHSPYMVEALKTYSDKLGLKEKTTFSLAEKDNTGFNSQIIEVTDDISPIFELLVEPYNIMDEVREADDE